MDIESSRLLLKNVIEEHPELLNEVVEQNGQIAKPREKMEPQVIRMPISMKTRIDAIARHLVFVGEFTKKRGAQAQVIRDALEIGLTQIEQKFQSLKKS